MLENGKKPIILSKSYEIGYALWRIAANIPEKQFADKISGKAVELLDFAANSDYQGITAKASNIELFLRFGMDVGLIGNNNAAMLMKEIADLKIAVINESGKIAGKNIEVEIADIFSDLPEIEETNDGHDDDEEGGNIKADMRQSMILDKIRQTGNCRLSEIQEILPGVSDRTVRYDLESLVQQKLIERVGAGGRSVYYRVIPSN